MENLLVKIWRKKILISVLALMQFLVMTASYAACTWKTSDIMDERIDVGAQKSLMRQMSSGPPNSRIASAMIGAIKSGALAAIYLPPRQMVAQRAARMTPKKGYWQLLQGRNSTCLREPAGEPPLIVYREKLSGGMIDVALREAWQQCGLPTPQQACTYIVDRTAPPSATPPESTPSDTPPAHTFTANLTVHVYDAKLGFRIPLAKVTVMDRAPSGKVYSNITDPNGNASFNLNLGSEFRRTYYIQADPPDNTRYLPNSTEWEISAGSSPVISLQLSVSPKWNQ